MSKYGIKPKDRYSQSFVVNPSLVLDIINELKSNVCKKSVIEIGSGLGTITYYLSLEKRVVAIEIDEKLAFVTRSIVEKKNCVVVNADALQVDFSVECVVSNTPYHISSDLLVKIARENRVRKAVLVLQKEVVDRLTARPGTKNYGRLTILINLLFDVVKKKIYPPSYFYPRPQVYSQLIILERKRKYNNDIATLEEITRLVFSERRKKALRVLEKKLGLKTDELKNVGIDDSRRVYQLEPRVLMSIVELVKQKRSI